MLTTAPPGGAGAERNISPKATFPPTMVVGKTPTDDTDAAAMLPGYVIAPTGALAGSTEPGRINDTLR
jgi:hypothetical protein